MKIKLFVKYISLLVLLFVVDGCKEKKADTYVTKVTDLTGEEEQVLKLEYDRDGKIIKYGDTPVRYEGDQITIGQMNCLNTGNKLCNGRLSRTRLLLHEASAPDRQHRAGPTGTYPEEAHGGISDEREEGRDTCFPVRL